MSYIYMVYTGYILGYTMYIHQTVYPSDWIYMVGCHKRLNPTAANVHRISLVAAVTAAAVAGVAGVFQFLVAGNDLNLGERWGRGCFQGR